MNADVLTIIKNIEDRKPLATGHASGEFHVNPLKVTASFIATGTRN